jgi:hypothetical protein
MIPAMASANQVFSHSEESLQQLLDDEAMPFASGIAWLLRVETK